MANNYTQEDIEEISNSYNAYMTNSFDDWDTWLIEILQKKDIVLLDKELKRRRDLRNFFKEQKIISDV